MDLKPYRSHRESPPISIYILDDDTTQMEKLSCMWCKRTIADVKGRIDLVITTPMPIVDFGIAVNIRCKSCQANYRLLINPSILA